MGLKLAAGLTLDNGLRPQAIAGVAPTLDYRFARDKREIEAISLTDKLTFTGGNQGTFVGSDGCIQRATTNVPRFDHDPLSRASKGLLVEEQRTNLILQSEFQSNWVLFGSAGLTSNQALAPSGLVTAALTTSNNTTDYVYLVPSTTIGTAYTFSFFIKAGTSARSHWHVRTSSTVAFGQINWSNGNLASLDVSTGAATFADAGNGWYRISIVYTATETNARHRIGAGDNASTAGTAYIWGAQLEAASTPSTYIPTTTTSVTRTADSAVIDGTGVLTGTYTMVAKPEGSALVSGSTIVLQPGYTAERVMVFPAALSAAQITAIREAM